VAVGQKKVKTKKAGNWERQGRGYRGDHSSVARFPRMGWETTNSLNRADRRKIQGKRDYRGHIEAMGNNRPGGKNGLTKKPGEVHDAGV